MDERGNRGVSGDSPLRWSKISIALVESLVVVPSAIGIFFLLLIFLGVVAMFLSPAAKNLLFEEVFRVAIGILVFAVIVYQCYRWRQQRRSLSVRENAVMLVLFGLYGASAFGCVRFLVYTRNPANYHISEHLKANVGNGLVPQVDNSIRRSQMSLDLLQDFSGTLTRNCGVRLVDGWKGHLRFAFGGEKAIPKTPWKDASVNPEDCYVWIVRESWTLQGDVVWLARRPYPESEYVVYLQTPRPITIRREYLFFVKRRGFEVGAWPGGQELNRSQASLNDTIKSSYDDPLAKAKLMNVINSRMQWESLNLATLRESRLRITNPNSEDYYPIPLSRFVAVSIAEYLEAPSDLIEAVSLGAQALDILFHLLRYLFVLVFIESLVG